MTKFVLFVGAGVLFDGTFSLVSILKDSGFWRRSCLTHKVLRHVNSLTWVDIWFAWSGTCNGVWSSGVGQNRETDEEHDDDDGAEEEF